MCYGAQVWGFEYSETLELLLRFFVKKVLFLPKYCPNYLVYLETCLYPIFVYTLKLHLLYMHRLASLPEDRLPHILAKETVRLRCFWSLGWEELEQKYGVRLMERHIEFKNWSIKNKITEVLRNLKVYFQTKYICAAQASSNRTLYPLLLSAPQTSNYVYDCNTSDVMWIFKIRGELLDLNTKPGKTGTDRLCNMCNLEVEEDTFHFLAECPVLSEMRVARFGVASLSGSEAFEYANGKDWPRLVSYVKHAWRYRLFLQSNL